MTEIYGTLGPACASREILEQMFRVGLTGMRLNLSHTGLKESEALVENYRQAAAEVGVIPQLLIDMQGPELRIGKIKGARTLCEKDQVILSIQEHEKTAAIPVPEAVLNALEVGDEVLLNDGRILLRIDKIDEKRASAQVLRGGNLSGHKSIKIVDKQVEMPVLTPHDVENIRLAKAYGVTGLMQPFVKSGTELARVRKILAENHVEHVKIFAKLENRLAVDNLDSILQEADVVIIARGDLGNDMPLWELPGVQKDIEQACKKAGKPFVVVTQMLTSMEENPVPTRAEVSDIFNAVVDGAYGVMITGESAVGKYPVEAIRYLKNTAHSAERWMEKDVLV
jgi:pyruvate kinase